MNKDLAYYKGQEQLAEELQLKYYQLSLDAKSSRDIKMFQRIADDFAFIVADARIKIRKIEQIAFK